MAGRDKTGPLGAGPGTGRGAGGCVPGTYVQGGGRGRGRGCGLGFRFGRGMGLGQSFNDEGSLLNRIATLEDKIDSLLEAKKEG